MTGTRGSLEPYIKDDVVYYPHQIEGVRKLARMTSFLLADDMGLGKTIQSLTVFGIDVFMGLAKTAIVVCPVTLKGNWIDEIETFTRFKAIELGKAYKRNGSPRTASKAERDEQIDEFIAIKGPKILVVNYEQVISHLAQLKAINFDIAIADEAHNLKNPKAKRTKAFMNMPTRRSFLLTGSPMLNRADELWVLLHRIAPAEFPHYWTFRQRYCNTPDAPILMGDGTVKPIGEVQVGDTVMGWTEESGKRRTLQRTEVTGVMNRRAPRIIEATMESGSTVKCTPDHMWLSGNHNQKYPYAPIQPDRYGHRGTLSKVFDVLPEMTDEQKRAAAYIAGMYDGEGSHDFIAQSYSYNTAIYAEICVQLMKLDIPFSMVPSGIRLRGGRQTTLKFLQWIKPVKIQHWLEKRLMTQLNRTKDGVVTTRELGAGDVVALETGTGNYIAWGYASKNCVMGGFQNKEIVGVQNERELTLKLQAVMLRRLKKDVLNLKEPQIIPRRVDLSPEQRKHYDELFDNLKLEIPSNPEPLEVENGMVKLLRLKQICGTTATLFGQEHDVSWKLDLVVEDGQEILDNGNKIIVFTQFREVLEAYKNRMEKLGYKVFQLHGDVPIPARQDVVKAWSSHPGPAIIACMLQVAGIGLNMTSARHVQFIDKLFVPKLNQQAIDRAHRIGQDETQPVQVFEYITRDTIENRIEQILRSKAKLFDDVVETSNFKRMLLKAAFEDA